MYWQCTSRHCRKEIKRAKVREALQRHLDRGAGWGDDAHSKYHPILLWKPVVANNNFSFRKGTIQHSNIIIYNRPFKLIFFFFKVKLLILVVYCLNHRNSLTFVDNSSKDNDKSNYDFFRNGKIRPFLTPAHLNLKFWKRST